MLLSPAIAHLQTRLEHMSAREKRVGKTPTIVVVGAMVCLALCPGAQAQRASLIGSVSDPSGGLVPGVHITLLNLDQGLKRETSSNEEGYFSVPFLQPGNYVVTAEKNGFAVAEVKDVILHVGDVRGLSIRLQISAVPEQIEVSGTRQPVETVSPALAKVVTGEVVRNAPLDGRDIRNLALLQPGVAPADLDFLGAGAFTMSGNRGDSVNYLLDGGLNNDLVDNRTVYSPNPDTVAEFRVITSNYPAEYGRNSGGVITVATQSGTNQFHGGAFDFLRNDALDANSFFNKLNGLPRSVLKRNQFGGTFGGPFPLSHDSPRKGRYFFFVGYQGERQVQDLVQHDTPTFTPAELGGDFSRSGRDTGGNPIPDPNVATFLGAFPFFQPDSSLAAQAIIDPARINSVAQNYIAAGLIPTSPDGLLNSQEPFRSDRDELTTKFDFDLRTSDKLAVTLGWDRTHQLTPFDSANVPGFPDTSDFHDYFLNVGYTHMFSPELLNEFRITAQRVAVNAENPAARLPTPAELGISVTPDIATGPTSLFFDTGLQVGFGFNGPQRVTDNTFAYSDALTWTHGKHSWKFGGSFSAFQNSSFFSLAVNGQFAFFASQTSSGNSFADFLLGLPLQYIQGPAASSNIRSKFVSGFAQDDWRIRKNLVLSLGLRYEYSTPKSDTDGRTFSIIPGQQSRVFTDAPVGMVFPGDPGAPRGVNFPDRNDWAPRIGFAWDPKGNGKMSLRGAFGVFYDILKGEDNLQFNGKPPFFSSAGFALPSLGANPTTEPSFFSQPFAAAMATNPFPSRSLSHNVNFADVGFLPIGNSNSVFVVAPHLRTPYTYQYHLTLEREVAQNTVFEASYVGSSSHGLTGLVDINPFILGRTTRLLNPPADLGCSGTTGFICPFAQLREFRNVTNASYNSLLLSLQKQISDGGIFGRSYFTFAYTYSHNIDNASGFANRNFEVPYYQPNLFRSSADMDVTHRIVFSGGWEVPFERVWGSGPKRLTKGWNVFPIVNWRSGFPVDVFASLASAFNFTSPGPSGVGDANLVRANLIGPIRILDPHSPKNRYFDPSSFSTVQCDPKRQEPCPPGMFPNDDQVLVNPALRTYGTLPRNFFRGPGVFNINLAFSKTTPLTEHVHLEARADFFNLLNRAEFINPNTNIADTANFGRVQFTYQPRIIQLALRLSF